MGRFSLVEPHLRDGRLIAPFAERMPTGDALTVMLNPGADPRSERRAIARHLAQA